MQVFVNTSVEDQLVKVRIANVDLLEIVTGLRNKGDNETADKLAAVQGRIKSALNGEGL